MSHQIVTVTTDRHLEEEISNLLLTLGAEGIASESPHFIKNSIEAGIAEIWDESQLTGGDAIAIKGYFPSGGDWSRRKARIGEGIAALARLYSQYTVAVAYTVLTETGWEEAWKQYYKPFRVGKALVVKPLWEPYEAQAGDIVLELDPGLVFGTGDHPTTGGALCFLEEQVRLGMTVMDLGCGSGILGLAAAKLGAARIVAVDRDPEAVKATAANFAVNGLSDSVTVVEGDLSQDIPGLEGPFDIIAANIIAAVIIDILPLVRRVLKPGGLFITGGIIREKKERVLAEAQANGIYVVEIREEGDWVNLLMIRR